MRNKDVWRQCLTYKDTEGNVGTWVEEHCTFEHPWGLGCKVCRWAGVQTLFGVGDARGWRQTDLRALRRHGNHLRNQTARGRTVPARKERFQHVALHIVTNHDLSFIGFVCPMRNVQEHAVALQKLLATSNATPEIVRHDDHIPVSMIYMAYKVAHAGEAFQSYSRDAEVARASGTSLSRYLTTCGQANHPLHR